MPRLSRAYTHDDIAYHFGTPDQIVKAVNFNVYKKFPKLIAYHSNVSWPIAIFISVL